MSTETEQAILATLVSIRDLLATQKPAERLTREQAAASLNISLRSFDRIVKAGQLNRDQAEGPIRFRPTDIENYKKTRAATFRPRRIRRNIAA